MERSFAWSSENDSFTKKLKNRAETLFWKSAKCRGQGKSIPEIASKAKKIKGDKLPKVISSLVKSLDDRDLLALGRVMTTVGVPTTSETSVSFPGQ